MQIFLQSASQTNGGQAYINYKKTILRPKTLKDIFKLDSSIADEIKDLYKDDEIRVWGVTESFKGRWNHSDFINSVCMFTTNGKVISKSRICFKVKNSKLAKKLWNDNSFEYLFFIKDFVTLDEEIPLVKIGELAEYKGKLSSIRGLMRMDIKQAQISNILSYINESDLIDTQVTGETQVIMEDNEDTSFQNNIQNITNDNYVSSDLPEDKEDLVDTGNGKRYPRNPQKAKQAIMNAKYQCEVDNKHKSFKSKKTNEMYVEAHHLIPVSYHAKFSKSLDIEVNIVSLCPICHNLLHKGKFSDKKMILVDFYNKRKALLEKKGINISLDNFKNIYR